MFVIEIETKQRQSTQIWEYTSCFVATIHKLPAIRPKFRRKTLFVKLLIKKIYLTKTKIKKFYFCSEFNFDLI